MTDYANLKTGNSGVCSCCKGTKVMAPSTYQPGGVCVYCNGTGFKRNLTGVDDMGLPPNNAGNGKNGA